jgi:O-antigen ligase/tetratricopeptide (TPR) repeat protein
MKDITKGIVFSGIFIIPFISLFISNSLFFPFITGKNFAFRIIVEIIFAAWVILAFYETQYRPKFSWILGTFSAFLVIMFFANLFGEHPFQSFWSNFERMEGYVTLVHTFLYFLVLGSVLKTQKLWDRYFVTTIGVAILLSFYAFKQLSGDIVINQGGWRLDGTLGNSAYMAIYMLFLFFMTLYMFLKSKHIYAKYTFALLGLLFIFLLVQTATRGTTLGLIGGLFVMGSYIALFGKEYPRVRTAAGIGILTIIFGVALFVTFKESAFVQNNPYLQRIASISLKEAANRFNIWSMAFEGVKERPLLGWGQGNYTYVFNEYFRPELHNNEAWFDRVHNIVMDWLIAGGALGAFAYFSIYGSALYYVFVRPLRNKEDTAFTLTERGLLIGLLVGYLIHNMFVFDNIVSYIFYGTILAFIHSRVATPMPRIEGVKVHTSILEQIVVPVTGIVLVVSLYFVNVPGIQAAGDIIKAFRTTDPNAMMSWFESALERGSFGDQEIREQMTQRAQAMSQSKEVPQEIKDKAFVRVEEELLKQAKEKPDDARTHVFISSYYRMIGKFDEAAAQLEIARALSPKKQIIILEQGITALQRREYDKARAFFKEAYDLSPQFNDIRNFYAIGAAFTNDQALVKELIVTPEQLESFALNNLAIQAMYSAKMYPMLVEMFGVQIKYNPNDPQLRTSLAFIQSEEGDVGAAIATLTAAGEAIPSFKEQSEQFIASLVMGKAGATGTTSGTPGTKPPLGKIPPSVKKP